MLRFSAHLGYLFTELPLAARFAAAREAGFDAVEHPNPFEISPAAMRELLDQHGLDFVQFALPPGDPTRGEKGFAALPGRADEFRASVEIGLDYAEAVGARFIQLQSGLSPQGVDASRLWDTYIANLAVAARAAAARSIGVLIEPIGPATIAGYYLDRSDLALKALDAVDEPNLRLLFDVFHSANASVEPGAFIKEHVRRIGHLHIADHPGRQQPGTGVLDFPRLFALIAKSGYTGLIGCEYKPSGRTLDSLAWHKPHQVAPSSRAASIPT